MRTTFAAGLIPGMLVLAPSAAAEPLPDPYKDDAASWCSTIKQNPNVHAVYDQTQQLLSRIGDQPTARQIISYALVNDCPELVPVAKAAVRTEFGNAMLSETVPGWLFG